MKKNSMETNETLYHMDHSGYDETSLLRPLHIPFNE